jgi:pimeloyl-ACP methyl ester carboxylesterase
MMRFVRWKTGIVALLVVVLVGAGVLVGGGWYVADVLESDGLSPDHEEPRLDMVVDAVGEGKVTLRVTPDTPEDGAWMRNGTWGLKSAEGYGRVSAILDISDRHVVREYLPTVGSLVGGEKARVDRASFQRDPLEDFGLPFGEVSFSSPLGRFDAWFLEGRSDTWAIFVHGRGASRTEALRILPTVVDSGHPCLIITYRNDEGAPADPGGYYRYGQTEWEDLQGAAAYAIEHGARDLILIGYSMGGAIVVNFLYQSQLAERVRGVILDAPMVDFNATVDLGARERGLPGPFVATAKTIARLRFGVDWGKLDYLGRAGELRTPILLFHGDEDDVVPIETSEALAKARPDIVEYVSVAGAPHVGAWNLERAGYEAAVSGFLRRVTSGAAE